MSTRVGNTKDVCVRPGCGSVTFCRAYPASNGREPTGPALCLMCDLPAPAHSEPHHEERRRRRFRRNKWTDEMFGD